MNRYYKFNSKKLPKYGQAGEILTSPEMGNMYSQTGNIVGNAVEGTIDTNYTLDSNPYANDKMIWSNAARYAGQGAALGANPALVAATGGLSIAAGAALGAIGGGIYGAVQKDKLSKEYETWKDKTIKNTNKQGLNNYQTDIMMGFNPKGNRYATYPKGGQLPPIIVTDPNDPRLQAYQDSLRLYKNIPQTFNTDNMNSLSPVSDGRGGIDYNYYKNEMTNKVKNKLAVTSDLFDNEKNRNAYNRLTILNKTEPKVKWKVNGNKYTQTFEKPVQPVVYQKPKPVVKKENRIIGNQKTFNKLNSKSPLVLEKDGYYRNDAGDVFKFESKPVVKTDIADAPVLPNNKPTSVKKNTTTSTTSTTPIKKEPITPTPTTPVNNSPKFRIQGAGTDTKLGLDAQKTYTQQEIIDAAKKKGVDKELKFNKNMAYFAKGGNINIKPENKGKFTAWAKSHNMGVQEAASHVMANKEKYSSTIVKRANFAKNAKKFKHNMGGVLIRYANGGKIHSYEIGGNFQPEYEVEKNEVVQGNDVKLTNGKQISNDMHLATGYTHEQNNPKTGGTGVYGVGGQRVFSNRSMPSEFLLDSLKALKIPVSKKDTHANIVLSIAKKQNKFEKGIDAANHRERKTSEIMMERLNNAKELVFLDQELQKAPIENPNDQYMQGQDMQEPAYQQEQQVQAKGGMIKRKDGSYSKKGLWDNIRANKGSGKKPTKEMLEQEAKIKNSYAKGGYIVKRSSARKGKTHVVIGPDGTKKYFGDSKLGQHPNDPKRKKSFYARHKHNLAKNPYFRAFARATWADGGELPMNTSSRYINPIYSNKNLIKFAKGGKVKKYYEGGGNSTIKIAPWATNDPIADAYNWEQRNKQFRTMEQMGIPSPKLGVTGNRYSNIDYLTNPNYKVADSNKFIVPSPFYNPSIINPNEEDKGSMELATLAEQERKGLPMNAESTNDLENNSNVNPNPNNKNYLNVPNLAYRTSMQGTFKEPLIEVTPPKTSSNTSTTPNLSTPAPKPINVNQAMKNIKDSQTPVTNKGFNLKDNWGTIANTLNLVNNLQAVNNLKSFNNPQYPVAPRLQYNTNLPYNIYENAKAGRTALANLNRYNPSNANRYAIAANIIEGNNRAYMEDNLRRGEFNNQVALTRNAIDNQRIAMDNEIAKARLDLANEKVVQRNNAINTWATGEMQNKLYRDQNKLGKERMQLEFLSRYGNVGERAFKNTSDAELETLRNKITDPVIREQIDLELSKRKQKE